MANIIRLISGEENNLKPSSSLFVRPSTLEKLTQELEGKNFEPNYPLTPSNLHRRNALFVNPRMQDLKAKKKPPLEREQDRRSILEALVYQLENLDN